MSEVEQTTEQTTENPTIQLVDLANALRVVDVAAERGAFRGNELSQVGAIRDKIATFLNAVSPPANEGTGEETQEEEKK